jgi:hypothetical protein
MERRDANDHEDALDRGERLARERHARLVGGLSELGAGPFNQLATIAYVDCSAPPYDPRSRMYHHFVDGCTFGDKATEEAIAYFMGEEGDGPSIAREIGAIASGSAIVVLDMVGHRYRVVEW